MSIAAGRFDRRIAILQYGLTHDEWNQPAEGWTPLATVWAEATPVSDGERFRAAQVEATITVRFMIRWSNVVRNVNPKDRIEFDGNAFDIVGVKEIGRREALEITAAARADVFVAPPESEVAP